MVCMTSWTSLAHLPSPVRVWRARTKLYRCIRMWCNVIGQVSVYTVHIIKNVHLNYDNLWLIFFLDFGVYKFVSPWAFSYVHMVRMYIHVLVQIEDRHYLESTAAQTCASAITSILYCIYICMTALCWRWGHVIVMCLSNTKHVIVLKVTCCGWLCPRS